MFLERGRDLAGRARSRFAGQIGAGDGDRLVRRLENAERDLVVRDADADRIAAGGDAARQRRASAACFTIRVSGPGQNASASLRRRRRRIYPSPARPSPSRTERRKAFPSAGPSRRKAPRRRPRSRHRPRGRRRFRSGWRRSGRRESAARRALLPRRPGGWLRFGRFRACLWSDHALYVIGAAFKVISRA